MPNIQPSLGNGINASWDDSTNSFIISNDSASDFLWFKIFQQVPASVPGTEVNTFYYFQEVAWSGTGFTDVSGGLFCDETTQTTGPKAYPMPFVLDRRDNTTNDLSIQPGVICPARLVSTDSTDNREVYYFWCGVNPNNRMFVMPIGDVNDSPVMVGTRYSARISYVTPYGTFPPSMGSGDVWAIEINGSPLLPNRTYVGFSIGYWDPGNPANPNATNYNDQRPLVVCMKNGGTGPNAVRVVKDIVNNGASVVIQYTTFCPDEYTAIINTESTGLRYIDLLDTPKTYGIPGQYIVTTGSGFQYANAPTGAAWPTPPSSGTSLVMISQNGITASVYQTILNAAIDGESSIDVTGSFVNGVNLKLQNDIPSPGPNMYYGTDANGDKGWFPLP
jgi:hypothetical protein